MRLYNLADANSQPNTDVHTKFHPDPDTDADTNSHPHAVRYRCLS